MYLLHWIPEVDWVASNDLCIRLNIQPNSINSCMCLSDIFIFENDVLLSAGFEPTLLVHCRTHWMSILYIRLSYYDVDIPSLYNITSAGFPKQVLLYVCTFNQVSEINWISTSRKIFIETCFSNTLYQNSHTCTFFRFILLALWRISTNVSRNLTDMCNLVWFAIMVYQTTVRKILKTF